MKDYSKLNYTEKMKMFLPKGTHLRRLYHSTSNIELTEGTSYLLEEDKCENRDTIRIINDKRNINTRSIQYFDIISIPGEVIIPEIINNYNIY